MISRWFFSLSIASKLRIILLGAGAMFIIAFSGFYIYYSAHSIKENLKADTINFASLLGSRSVAAIRFDNADFARQRLRSIDDKSYKALCLYDADSKLFASHPSDKECPLIAKNPGQLFSEFAGSENGVFIILRNIVADGELIGAIRVERTQHVITDYIISQIQIMLIVALVSLALGSVVVNYLQRLISMPILEIAQNTQSLSIEAIPNQRIARKYDNELGQVAEAFNRVLSSMEEKLASVSQDRDKMNSAYQQTLKGVDNLLNQFLDSIKSMNVFSEMTTSQCFGPSIKNYLEYQDDVVEALGLYSANLEGFIRISKIYAAAIASPTHVIPLHSYCAEFSRKLKTSVPYISISFDETSLRKQDAIVNVHKIAWDEMFAIQTTLFHTLSGIVDFPPHLTIEYNPTQAMLSMSFFDKDQKSETASQSSSYIGQLNMELQSRSSVSSYRNNSIEDPTVAEEFLDPEGLTREDIQYVLDMLSYLGNANNVTIDHRFSAGSFSLLLDLNNILDKLPEVNIRMAIQ